MKKIIVVLLLLAPWCVWAGPNEDLQRAVRLGDKDATVFAIEAGATNVDEVLNDYMTKQYSSRKPNFAIIRVLMQHARWGYSDFQINKLYQNFIIRDCSGDVNYDERDDALSVIRFTAGSFKMSLDTRDVLADFTTDNDDDQKVVMCVMNYVSRYKMADEKFLDALADFAQMKNAKNVQTLVDALKAEIEKQKSENVDKI